MKCERCHKFEATVHFSDFVSNTKSEIHLCEHCAMELGLGPSPMNVKFSTKHYSDIFNFSSNLSSTSQKGKVCQICGTSLIDYKYVGKLGCPSCYHYLQDEIVTIIKEINKNKKYIGKKPLNFMEYVKLESVEKDKNNYNENLEILLEIAVAEEKYEDAAKLRDRIKNNNDKGDFCC